MQKVSVVESEMMVGRDFQQSASNLLLKAACFTVKCSVVKDICYQVSNILLIFGFIFLFSDLEALKNFRNQLTVYEQKEIFNYTELWFLGLEAKKIEGLPETQNNNCYDDEHGSYLKVSGKIMVFIFS